MSTTVDFDFTEFADDARQAGVSLDSVEIRSAQGVKLKLLIWLLRNGAESVAKALKMLRLSGTAAEHVVKRARQVADLLERTTQFATDTLAAALRGLGIPEPYAHQIASAVIWFAF